MEKEQLNHLIGKRLKELRRKKGWNLEDTAKHTGVSKPMLGQIERGESNPTVGTLWKIANGLQVAFSVFIDVDRPSAKHVKYQNLETIESEPGGFHVKPLFAKDQYTPMESFYVEMDEKVTYESAAHPEGVEEYIFLQRGSLEVLYHSEKFALEKGDALRFRADVDHVYRNPGETRAVFTMMIHYSNS
ncbi:helix-turn-helix domain-containing protein [Alteribacillus sp. HJP-4]|uniref:helix-turn-helix domain-containing protein n=1 Tax=Alteribacillus sp. HJP-4 TaxID=2775394 RepID=UPI0035CD0BD1